MIVVISLELKLIWCTFLKMTRKLIQGMKVRKTISLNLLMLQSWRQICEQMVWEQLVVSYISEQLKTCHHTSLLIPLVLVMHSPELFSTLSAPTSQQRKCYALPLMWQLLSAEL